MDGTTWRGPEEQVEEIYALWTRCAASLREQLPEAAWQMWLAGVEPLSARPTESSVVLVLGVPNQAVRDRVESRYLARIRDTLAMLAGQEVQVELQVQRDVPVSVPVPPLDPIEHPVATVAPGPEETTTILDPRFTFDSFVSASSNRLAYAAAQAVAETPGRSYNPLYIYGDSGLGKTHLLHAIGNYVRQNFPRRKVRYVTTETFMNDYVEALRLATTMAFKRRYRDCDVLLIDDIQFMQGKNGLQEEFFHTYNDLHGTGRQIVLTSDRAPKSIETLQDRLRSRFLSGLITEIEPPDLETRLAILRSKAAAHGMEVPNDILEFIATHVTNNIRELEGALVRVSAFASLNQQPFSLALAEKVLADMVSATESRQITPQAILETTAAYYGFTVDALCGPSRTRPLVTARQVAMYLVRDLTDHSYPAIARIFGGRDHTTVIHAVEKITEQMMQRRQIYDQVTDLIYKIKSNQ